MKEQNKLIKIAVNYYNMEAISKVMYTMGSSPGDVSEVKEGLKNEL